MCLRIIRSSSCVIDRSLNWSYSLNWLLRTCLLGLLIDSRTSWTNWSQDYISFQPIPCRDTTRHCVCCSFAHARCERTTPTQVIWKKNIETRRKPISDQSCWLDLKSASSWWSSLRVTLSAVYGFAAIGLEWDFTILSTISTDCLVHLSSFIRQLSQLLYGCCAKIASYTLRPPFTPLLINNMSQKWQSLGL
jgi:hypothetical protein